MKAAINGTPNLSIGDGWWAEGYTGTNGWLIEGRADPNDHGAQDWADVQALYDMIEQQVVPAFYTRDTAGIPRRWVEVMRQSILSAMARFSARRMVKDYVRDVYRPAVASPSVSKPAFVSGASDVRQGLTDGG
jgi:starch phosphorylase